MLLRTYIILVLLTCANMVMSQNGIVRGTVFDDSTGESLPAVTIVPEGTTLGTLTDLDGQFNLSIPAGKYTLRFSFISYETTLVREVEVLAGEVTLLGEIRLKESQIQLSEVEVTARASRNTETALLTMKQKSATLIDGISAASFRKTGDSDAAASMKRVTGVTIEGGKYIVVRGLGDRYTKTMLNGMDIPGLDPDRNTLQMDIFPLSVIDNIVVIKSASANLPADFTGGMIDITTKDFPDRKTLAVTAGVSYNPLMHFNDGYLYYEGGKTDFLALDDGTRAIPATSDIPRFTEIIGNPGGERAQRFQSILKAFNPTLAAMKKRSFMDYSFGISAGNQVVRGKTTWGYNAALTYKHNTTLYTDAEFGRYGLSGNPGITEMELREYQLGDYGTTGAMIGTLAGIAMKTAVTRVKLNVMHLRHGESTAGIFTFINNDQGAYFEGMQHNLEYSQRSLTSIMAEGKHSLPRKLSLLWKVSPALSQIEDPDIRFTRYELRDGAYKIGTESGFPERIWRDLSEYNLSGIVNLEKEFRLRGQQAIFSMGASAVYKERDYVIRNFQLNIRNIPLSGDPDELFDPSNLWPYEGNAGRGTTFEAPFLPNNPNKFNATALNGGLFASIEMSPMANLKAILGLRTELFRQHYTGTNQLGTQELNNDLVLDDLDFFPSANLIYALAGNQNLRLSVSKTIARPSFRELSYAEIFDPISGRLFIGGLFRDANDANGVVYWDGNLQSTDILNADLRWEWFGTGDQMYSVSAFYKQFSNPIEIVQFATQTGAFQPRNVGDGTVAGGEFEMRQNMGIIGEKAERISLIANITYAWSAIKLSSTEFESRKANARNTQQTDEYRSMASQAPYIINAGLAYNGGEKGIGKSLEAGLYYNVQGKTLEVVGIADRPDIYTLPFNSLNLNINKRFGKNNAFQLGLKADNILNAKKESVFNSFEADPQYYTRLSQGTTFRLTLGYNVF